MGYRENVDQLAAKWQITNDPELRLDDLELVGLIFELRAGILRVPIGENNKGGALFMQDCMYFPEKRRRLTFLSLKDEFRLDAALYYGDRWKIFDPARQLLLRGCHEATGVRATWR